MSNQSHPVRFCSRCGKELPPRATIAICLLCAFTEAAAAAEPATEQPLLEDDLQMPQPEPGPAVENEPKIGRYKILEKIGEGGWGVVYVAEQQEPIRRQVALKVIKLGMDTRAVVARFEAERQALALMDHPNIAKVLDAGATDKGRPFFVMELVRGIRITDYCDQAKVRTQERLRLFIQVCQAIQHAHQKGIIHRDIKPSNVLVTLHDGVPVPKVIDFGIAKATEGRLTDETFYTQIHQFVGTPAYMSPEQAEMSGWDIDTRSDLYSLGVLLYELLTGCPPFDPKELLAAGLELIRRTIREKEPLRPSTRLASLPGKVLTTAARRRSVVAEGLIHQVKGDLDWIVMKCLEKDRNRRYETANGLARDIQRHLENEPVTACPPSMAYRFQKMVQRNRKTFVGTVTVALALIIGFSTAMVGLIQAVRAKAKETLLRQQAQTLELASRRRAYAAEINSASQALAENNLSRARELVDKQRPKPGEPDLRGWEWRYLWQQCQPNEFAAFKDGEGWSIAFSPGGKFLLYSAPGPNRTVVREVKSSLVVTNLQPYAATLSFSPAAGLLAIGGLTNVGIWNLETWQIVQSLPGVTFPAKFSPDGRWLVTWGTNQFQLWDTETWRILQVCPGEVRDLLLERNSVAFSPNSGLLATPDNFGSFKLWKVPSLEPVPGFTEAKHRLTDGTDMVISTAFSANNKDLLVGWKDGTLQVWDLDQSKLVRSEKAHTSFISAIAVASDGSILATASNDSTLRLWDAATYKPLACLRGELGLIWSTDLSADRKTIASTGLFGTKLWKADLHQSVDLMTNAMVINGFLPTSDTLVATVKNGVILWNYATNSITEIRVPGIELDPYYFFSRSVGLKRNEASAAVGKTNGIIEIWDLSTRTPQTHWQAHSNRIFSVAFGANDTQLATGSESGEVKVWNVATHQLAGEFRPFEQRIFCVTFSPDGQMLAASGRTNKVWIANLEGKREPMRLHVGGWITGVVFSPNGELLAAHTFAEHAIYLWEVHTGTLRTILRGSDHAFDLGFTPDGETLAVGANDGLVTLWHTATQQQLIRIPVDGWFNKLCFSPDGQILAVGSGKGIRLWRMPSLKWIDSQVNKQVGGK